MRFVLDASVTMAWFLKEPGPSLDEIIDAIVEEGAVVPFFWTLEVANVFQSAIRRNRTTSRDRDAAFAQLRLLPIAIDEVDRDTVWLDVVALSGKHVLTVYDAIYLEASLRYGIALATLDDALIKAARAEGVEVLP